MSEKEKCQYIITHELLSSRCWRNTLPDSKFCIFHDRKHEKDLDAFNREIKKMLEEMPNFYDFTGFCFPKDFNFEVICQYLKNRTFEDAVNFSQAAFQGRVSFIDVRFRGANFLDATFQDRAYFTNAKFQEGANFEEATFQKIVSFIGTSFFTEELESLTIFQHAKFQDNASFRCAIFEEVNFQNTIFEKMADFAGSTFIEANFQNAKFRDITEFSYHKIEDKKRYPKFKIVDFSNAIFIKKANFEGCKIEEKIDFQNAEFQNEFLLINIHGDPIFDFKNTKFSDKTRIGGGTNLERALFSGSTAELVDFTDAIFPEKIYEERLLEKKFHGQLEKDEEEYCPESWQEVSTIYRKLKQAHQKYGDYAKAGEFFYREMECKKKSYREEQEWHWNRVWLWFYKILCGYGERVKNIVGCSAFIVFLCSFFYYLSGISRIGEGVIKFSFESGFSLKEFGYSIYYSIVTFTSLGYGDIHPLGWSHVIASIEVILGVFFMSLFVVVFVRKMSR